jgi:hypothetical protein
LRRTPWQKNKKGKKTDWRKEKGEGRREKEDEKTRGFLLVKALRWLK